MINKFHYDIDFLGYIQSDLSEEDYFFYFFKEIKKSKGKYLHISKNMEMYFKKIFTKKKDVIGYFEDYIDKKIINTKYDDKYVIISNDNIIENTKKHIKSHKFYNYPNVGHVVVDLETMGNKSYSPIISIGAVEFDIETGKTYREFYMPISLKSSLDINTKINADTILWWMRQNDDARKVITDVEGYNVKFVLNEFRKYINNLNPDNLQVWGNSNRFDLGILDNSYELIGEDIPWHYYMERDIRTLVSFYPKIKEKFKNNFKGVQHNPIDDCKNEIGYSSEIYRSKILKLDILESIFDKIKDGLDDELKEEIKNKLR